MALLAIPSAHELDCKESSRRVLPNIYAVFWGPPSFPWIKINTDGASKGNPGPAGCGAVFRDCQGLFCGGFSFNIGFQNALYAELMAIMVAVEFAIRRGWNHLWLESDSTCALQCLSNECSRNVPSELRSQWLALKAKIGTIRFQSSHIFREGNAVADLLANMGLDCSSLTWWNSPPLEIQQLLLQDILGTPKYRVR